ncbi:MAG: RNA 2',3'-cyclic phosphodiesterase [Armatimonadetes bacterium]|nr:RNA 2',3'-cyclic phosphodiesterase [Armatimonadota bacterium]NIM23083.1 RNA 2',3'-cyclic phosphodiesterase [Armatimonadota bacterium]NIM66951.1 RNA 2',3'-cyclic phosphodiesterase [Armatimonadota bacterium]NIM75485.1 RNA 2',3'-cyclic phosphodiesterase [Armatimonadota bacterium]NIN05142.1 RNA 2',3'-cyclic phosphodiesterase [Armatimonadota bacterium]
MRIFIAIEINEEIREKLAQAQQHLMKAVSGVKWVEAKNFHLTLKFLGETDQGMVSRLANQLGGVLASTCGFPLRFAGAGVFPNERRPRVIWVGVNEGVQPLFALAQKVEAVSQNLGFEAENRPFSGHLTLGRARGVISAAALKSSLEGLSGRNFGDQRVDHITIMQSTLTRAGPIYRPVHKLPLQAQEKK